MSARPLTPLEAETALKLVNHCALVAAREYVRANGYPPVTQAQVDEISRVALNALVAAIRADWNPGDDVRAVAEYVSLLGIAAVTEVLGEPPPPLTN